MHTGQQHITDLLIKLETIANVLNMQGVDPEN